MRNLGSIFSFVSYFSLTPSHFAAQYLLWNGQRTVVCSCYRFVVYKFSFCGTLNLSRAWKESHLPFFTHWQKRATRNEHYYFPIPVFPLILDSQGEPTGLCWSILHMFRLDLREQWLFSSCYFFYITAAFLIFWNNL